MTAGLVGDDVGDAAAAAAGCCFAAAVATELSSTTHKPI